MHGQQGIVPGNRLKVIPPVELDQFEQTTKNGIHDLNITADGSDFAPDGAPHNYDYLPNPVKTPGFVPTLSIKDMFDIPFKTNTDTSSKELYDVPNSLNSTQEIYDVPTNTDKTDISTSRSPGYDSPRASSAVNLTTNIGGSGGVVAMETYDVPSSLQNLSTLGRKSEPQQYSVPSSLPNLNAKNLHQYNRMKSKSDLEVDQLMDEIMDSPFNEEPNVSTIKRSPMNSNNSTPRSSYTSVNNTNRNSNPQLLNGSQEIYDVPKKDQPGPPQQQQQYSGNGYGGFQKKNFHLQSPATNSLSHTLPRGFSPRANNLGNIQGKITPTRLQEIYDIPSTTIAANRSLPGTPISSRKSMKSDVQTTPSSQAQQEIYDVPAPRTHQDPITNPEFMSMLHQLERQESFSSKRDSSGSLSKRGSMGSSSKRGSRDSFHTPPQSRNSCEFYDVPTHRSPRTSAQCSNSTSSSVLHQSKQEIYDVPPSSTNGGASTQELYDIPTSRATEALNRASTHNYNNDVPDGQELYDVPPNQTSTPRAQEIYDVPPSSVGRELYDVPPSKSPNSQQELYDVPPKTHATVIQQDIYDVPSTHNIDDVMAEAAYSSHKGHRNYGNNNNNNLLTTPDVLDDDYVDYHDIWTREPPKELISLHDKVGSKSPLFTLKCFIGWPATTICKVCGRFLQTALNIDI